MSSSTDAIRSSSLISDAVDAACNARAFFLFFFSALLALAIVGVVTAIAAQLLSSGAIVIAGVFSVMSGLLALLISATGAMAAGKTLMDAIQGRAQLSAGEALLAGLLTLPKLLTVVLIEFGVFLIFVIVLAIVLFICKIPVLGPLVYTVIYPISSVLAGMLFFSFAFIVNPLAAPAFWDNYSIGQAMAVFGLSKKALNVGRLFRPILQQLVLFVAVMIVSFIASAIVFGGSAFVGLVSAGILGFGHAVPGIFSSLTQGGGFVSSAFAGGTFAGGGYLIGTAIGLAILAVIAYTFPLLVYMAGTSHIFLNLANGGTSPQINAVHTPKTDNRRSKYWPIGAAAILVAAIAGTVGYRLYEQRAKSSDLLAAALSPSETIVTPPAIEVKPAEKPQQASTVDAASGVLLSGVNVGGKAEAVPTAASNAAVAGSPASAGNAPTPPADNLASATAAAPIDVASQPASQAADSGATRAAVARNLADGNRCFNDTKFDCALSKANAALRLDPHNEQAATLLRRTKTVLVLPPYNRVFSR